MESDGGISLSGMIPRPSGASLCQSCQDTCARRPHSGTPAKGSEELCTLLTAVCAEGAPFPTLHKDTLPPRGAPETENLKGQSPRGALASWAREDLAGLRLVQRAELTAPGFLGLGLPLPELKATLGSCRGEVCCASSVRESRASKIHQRKERYRAVSECIWVLS